MARRNSEVQTGSIPRSVVAKIMRSAIIKADMGSALLDPFADRYGSGVNSVIPPPIPLEQLASITDVSPELRRCIEAMVTNVHKFGYELVPPDHMKKEGHDSESKEAQEEHDRLTDFFNVKCNPSQSFADLRAKFGQNYEQLGGAYIEVVSDRKGEPAELYVPPAQTIRMTPIDKEWTEYNEAVRTASGKFEAVRRRKRFRRFVQQLNGKKVYFKEWGDPRRISRHTGQVVSSTKEEATELIYVSQYILNSPYGAPRYVPNIMGIMGNYKSEIINYEFFEKKGIPEYIIMVSGGRLTEESLDMMNDIWNTKVKGLANFHNGLILEGIADDSNLDLAAAGKVPPFKIDIKPLRHFIQDDAMFTNFRAENDQSLRSTFKLPGIYTGRSEDYTRATVKEAIRMGEDQVFNPERKVFDRVVNRTLLSRFRINYWSYRSSGAKLNDDTEILESIATVKDCIPLGIIIEMVQAVRKEPMPDIPEEWKTMTLGMVQGQVTTMPPEDPEQGNQVEKLFTLHKALKDKLKLEDDAIWAA